MTKLIGLPQDFILNVLLFLVLLPHALNLHVQRTDSLQSPRWPPAQLGLSPRVEEEPRPVLPVPVAAVAGLGLAEPLLGLGHVAQPPADVTDVLWRSSAPLAPLHVLGGDPGHGA